MLLLATVLVQGQAIGQAVGALVDCNNARLALAERETCASPDLMRLTSDVDRLTSRLEGTLTMRNRKALLDTEKPFRVQRNNCQNAASGVHECIDRVLRHRLEALTAAAASPATILSEIPQYTFLDIPYFLTWGPQLLGKRVSVWGCMTLDPGPTPASRLHGTITTGDCYTKTKGPYVRAIFRAMDETRATWFDDAKRPGGYWEGVVERRDTQLVLAQIEREPMRCTKPSPSS